MRHLNNKKVILFRLLVLVSTLVSLINTQGQDDLTEEQQMELLNRMFELSENARELYPDLFNITYIKENTHNYDYFRVELKETPTKGVGVFATRKIPENRTILYYKLKVHHLESYMFHSNGTFAFKIPDKSGTSINEELIADIFARSLQKPKARIPFWGYLTNEPDESQTPNAYADSYLEENYRNRDVVAPGDIMYFKLIASRDIEKGEEITWCYGSKMTRRYTTICDD